MVIPICLERRTIDPLWVGVHESPAGTYTRLVAKTRPELEQAFEATFGDCQFVDIRSDKWQNLIAVVDPITNLSAVVAAQS